LSGLSKPDRDKIGDAIVERLKKCQPEEQVSLLAKFAAVCENPMIKHDIWEINHSRMIAVIAGHLAEHGTMPNQSVLAEKTGISRQSIVKHLKEYRKESGYAEKIEKLKMMKMTVIEYMLARALAGDLRASKIFLDTMSRLEDKEEASIRETEKNQSSYIQITGVMINNDPKAKENPKPIEIKGYKKTKLKAHIEPGRSLKLIPASQRKNVSETMKKD
jgi:hypothetical protein